MLITTINILLLCALALERLVPSKAVTNKQGYNTFSIPETEDEADALLEEESGMFILLTVDFKNILER